MPTFPISSNAVEISQSVTQAGSLQNTGSNPIYLGNDPSVSPTNYSQILYPAATANWSANSSLWVIAASGAPSTLAVQYGINNVQATQITATASITGPVTATTPIGPVTVQTGSLGSNSSTAGIDVGAYESLLVKLSRGSLGTIGARVEGVFTLVWWDETQTTMVGITPVPWVVAELGTYNTSTPVGYVRVPVLGRYVQIVSSATVSTTMQYAIRGLYYQVKPQIFFRTSHITSPPNAFSMIGGSFSGVTGTNVVAAAATETYYIDTGTGPLTFSSTTFSQPAGGNLRFRLFGLYSGIEYVNHTYTPTADPGGKIATIEAGNEPLYVFVENLSGNGRDMRWAITQDGGTGAPQ